MWGVGGNKVHESGEENHIIIIELSPRPDCFSPCMRGPRNLITSRSHYVEGEQCPGNSSETGQSYQKQALREELEVRIFFQSPCELYSRIPF